MVRKKTNCGTHFWNKKELADRQATSKSQQAKTKKKRFEIVRQRKGQKQSVGEKFHEVTWRRFSDAPRRPCGAGRCASAPCRCPLSLLEQRNVIFQCLCVCVCGTWPQLISHQLAKQNEWQTLLPCRQYRNVRTRYSKTEIKKLGKTNSVTSNW